MKIVILCPSLYGQENLIKAAFVRSGYAVDLIAYDEKDYFRKNRPLKGLFWSVKMILWFLGMHTEGLKWWNRLQNWIFFDQSRFSNDIENAFRELHRMERSYDDILVIKGFGISNRNIQLIKRILRPKRTILYQWDPLIRYPSVLGIYPYFDKVLTFDSHDVHYYPSSKYLPTYCVSAERQKIDGKLPSKYDLVFVGAFTTFRYSMLKRLARLLAAKDIRYKFILVTQKRWLARLLREDIVSANALSTVETEELYRQSACIIDIGHPGQSGFTQRIYDALLQRKKIITTSKGVEHERFYLNDVIHVWKEGQESKILDFLRGKHVEHRDVADIEGYSVDNWVRKVIQE